MNLVRPLGSTNEQQGPPPKRKIRLKEPNKPAHLNYASSRFRPLQCGEAYYSVYATNNLSCDEPFEASHEKRISLFSSTWKICPIFGPQNVVLRPHMTQKEAALSDK